MGRITDDDGAASFHALRQTFQDDQDQVRVSDEREPDVRLMIVRLLNPVGLHHDKPRRVGRLQHFRSTAVERQDGFYEVADRPRIFVIFRATDVGRPTWTLLSRMTAGSSRRPFEQQLDLFAHDVVHIIGTPTVCGARGTLLSGLLWIARAQLIRVSEWDEGAKLAVFQNFARTTPP